MVSLSYKATVYKQNYKEVVTQCLNKTIILNNYGSLISMAIFLMSMLDAQTEKCPSNAIECCTIPMSIPPPRQVIQF